MDTNRSQPPSHHHHLSPCNQGPRRPPATLATVHSEVLRSWPHMWVPQGCMEGISLSERAPTRPSCYDPPSCGHISSCPSSRCEPEGHLEAPMSVCVCVGHTPVSAMSHPLALDAIDLSMRWIGLWCRCNVSVGVSCICVDPLAVCDALAFLLQAPLCSSLPRITHPWGQYSPLTPFF